MDGLTLKTIRKKMTDTTIKKILSRQSLIKIFSIVKTQLDTKAGVEETEGKLSKLEELNGKYDTDDADLDITDENGNVIARFNDGHIRTKNFNSSVDAITEAQKTKLEGIEEGAEVNDAYSEENSECDFAIADEDNNVLAEFKDGHLRTKNFDSRPKKIFNPLRYTKIISSTNKVYFGEKIDVSVNPLTRNQYFVEEKTSTHSPQGSACFGKYLFQCYDYNDYIGIYDMETKTKLQDVPMSSNAKHHCNNANFGTEYYAEGDRFPLLYVSMEHADEHKCLVYRISGNDGAMSISLVQTITFPTPSSNFLFYPNVLIDRERNKMVVYGLGNTPCSREDANIIRFKVFPLPRLVEGNITLDVSTIEDYFELTEFPTGQGGFILNGKIYLVVGVPNASSSGLKSFVQFHVIDIITHKVISSVDLQNTGLTAEVEGAFAYNGNVYLNDVYEKIHKYTF